MRIEPPGSAIFGKIMDDYLAQLKAAWDLDRFQALGATVEGDQVVVPLYGLPYRVSPAGISGPQGEDPLHAIKVILCKYLLLGNPERSAGREWVAYKQFPDAAPFVEGFTNTVERRITKAYTDRLDDLQAACQAWSPRPASLEVSYDLVMELPALPLVPVLLLFNDQDGPLPASCGVLFKDGAPAHLDMECLAMIGMVLASWLCSDGTSL